jgi:hypothetical protein
MRRKLDANKRRDREHELSRQHQKRLLGRMALVME